MIFENKRMLISGGTGSLGNVLVRRLLTGELGKPKKIIVFSRDEAKQHEMRMFYKQRAVATDEVIYQNSKELLEFRIGDVRDIHSISSVLKDVDIVFNAAALKQVPTCEYFPFEAVQTNIGGVENIVRAIKEQHLPVETVIGISTDKACKPVNVMGMSKAIQERILIQANMNCPQTRFTCVRYGNVLASRGSVIPLFHEQIRTGGPITITTVEMTRFLLSLEDAVDVIFTAVREANSGETYVPLSPSAKIIDLASLLIGKQKIDIVITGIRPGEKAHEILISEEECHRTIKRSNHYVIQPILPELRLYPKEKPALEKEYSSADNILDRNKLHALLVREKLSDPFNSKTEELFQ
ncbi:MAG: polysaccharide biosynthesis protein [Candidatus Aminicenantes bacterium]|nr:polysaccharide biosynthesis protein [Candidatus Aminicenantes bacterium]